MDLMFGGLKKKEKKNVKALDFRILLQMASYSSFLYFQGNMIIFGYAIFQEAQEKSIFMPYAYFIFKAKSDSKLNYFMSIGWKLMYYNFI